MPKQDSAGARVGESPATVDAPDPSPASANGSTAALRHLPPPASERDYGVWLIVAGIVLSAILMVGLVALPGSRPVPEGAAVPDDEFTRIFGSVQGLLAPSNHSLPVVLGKLMLAALLGGLIGYRQRLHVEEYIVHAHVIIAFTGALMMIIIGNEIVRAVGLLGAGSIIRYRTPVRDPKALASLFVTMGIGIAIGIGLFELAFVAGVLIVALQGMMGSLSSLLPATLYNPQRGYTLTVTADDGIDALARLKACFATNDIRYRLLEYDARAGKKDNTVKIALAVEANAHVTTEDLTLLVLEHGVQSVHWEEEA
ncbi:MAG: MgtC/SapB family protein [Chloroflexi bacterium]|nr:MgtC/SapB family protein [Chloroflexota bacterium]